MGRFRRAPPSATTCAPTPAAHPDVANDADRLLGELFARAAIRPVLTTVGDVRARRLLVPGGELLFLFNHGGATETEVGHHGLMRVRFRSLKSGRTGVWSDGVWRGALPAGATEILFVEAVQ